MPQTHDVRAMIRRRKVHQQGTRVGVRRPVKGYKAVVELNEQDGLGWTERCHKGRVGRGAEIAGRERVDVA